MKAARFSLVVVVLALYFMSGCTAAIRPNEKADLKIQLEAVAQHYDAYRKQFVALNEMGLIDPVTWAALTEIDLFFNEQYSEALVALETGLTDWRSEVRPIAQVIHAFLPIVEMGSKPAADVLGVVVTLADLVADGQKPPPFRVRNLLKEFDK